MSTEQDRMPFTEHLEELRKRLITCAIAVGIGFVICYFFKEKIFAWLMKPLIDALPADGSRKLIYTAPHEAFLTYLKVSFLAGVGLAVPVILFQFWRFVAPGLYEHERRYLYPIVILSTVFFLGGALFGYYVVFPYGFQFFASFATELIAPMISTKEFLSFATRLLFAFGIIFELPLITFFLAKLGLISSSFLRRQRKYAILLIFVVAAFFTPPDVFTQILMAGPLLILYEMSVWIAHFFGKKEEADDTAQAEEETAPTG
ncbi:Sec-independent protein translocase TatC [Desulfacinum hydrothermale DSM 13146]|uniref:Sec-independent protein translocase protein TatC n=1 Tax=Desulfacinum hydrothermale DSM 13146 TaxID=1121390 RepID=A0A1W1X7R2_9BACT|nr:twin-arginine translocase subunit TatC [Desulfacinum hydrothermale]SMC19979.1 Sec-independent protein translocase TatC [Desulfacinum hydrothermale DSM 13146]